MFFVWGAVVWLCSLHILVSFVLKPGVGIITNILLRVSSFNNFKKNWQYTTDLKVIDSIWLLEKTPISEEDLLTLYRLTAADNGFFISSWLKK